MDAGCKNVERALDPERQLLTLPWSGISTRTLLGLDLLPGLRSAPCLSPGRNGSGRPAMRLSYRTPDGQGRSLYLGALNPNDERLLRNQITKRWPVTRHELHRTIRSLRARRRQLRQEAHALAASCGYVFRGWMLHRRST